MKDMSQEQRINKGINVKEFAFEKSDGVFKDVHKGQLLNIVKRFNKLESVKHEKENALGLKQSQYDILQLLNEQDEYERTPLDLAW